MIVLVSIIWSYVKLLYQNVLNNGKIDKPSEDTFGKTVLNVKTKITSNDDLSGCHVCSVESIPAAIAEHLPDNKVGTTKEVKELILTVSGGRDSIKRSNKDDTLDKKNLATENTNFSIGKHPIPSVTVKSFLRNIKGSKMAFALPADLDVEQIQRNNPNVSIKWLVSAIQKDGGTPTRLMQDWLAKIEQCWYDDNADKTKATTLLHQYFSESSNPYTLTAFLIESAKDFHTGKTTTLAYFIMKSFDKWCRRKQTPDLDNEQYLNQDIRLHIFYMTTSFHMTMFDMAVKNFQLDHEGNEYFLPAIHDFLEQKRYKEAALCTGKLCLQDHFTPEQIALPLVLQDKVNLVEVYLCGNPEQQKKVVQMLDYLCDRGTSIEHVIRSCGVANVKRDKMARKTLSKLAIRLMKLYQVPQELCPNIMNARGVGAIRYLLHRTYIEKNMGTGSWEELVQSAVGNNSYLKEQLVEQLFCYNEYREAAKWANLYELDDAVIPKPIVETRHTIHTDVPKEDPGEESWDSECFSTSEIQASYHSLSLPMECVSMVDDREKYDNSMTCLMQPGQIVGFDSEWRPGFGGVAPSVALIQLAVRDHIFLFDVPALKSVLTDVDWTEFAKNIFSNQQILKLGFGLDTDLQMLTKSFPTMKEPMLQMARVVDLSSLSKQIHAKVGTLSEESGMVDDVDSDEGGAVITMSFSKPEERGLSELVKQCLGKPLNKSEQMSDWERRPLRLSQRIYAALDAFVLLEVYKVFVTETQQRNLHVNLEPQISMKWLKTSKKEKKRAKIRGDKKVKMPKIQQVPALEPNVVQAISPKDLHVVVDSMLQGLGRQLRSCGVDVKILENYDDHDSAIEISHRENRIVLTSGRPYQMIRAHVGGMMCYNVKSDRARIQVQEVLSHFNVCVRQEDIFSRCQVCNGNDYINIPSKEMRCLWGLKWQSLAPENQYNDDDGDNENSGFYFDSGSSLTDHFSLQFGKDKLHEYGIDSSTLTIAGNGVALQVETIPEAIFDKVDTFYCCATCGKIFWEGSHFERVCEQFSHVLEIDGKNNPELDGINFTVYDFLQNKSFNK